MLRLANIAIAFQIGFESQLQTLYFIIKSKHAMIGVSASAERVIELLHVNRPKDVSSYGFAESGRLGNLVLQCEAMKSIRTASQARAVSSQIPNRSLILDDSDAGMNTEGSSGAPGLKTVLVGHSMGSVCAAEEVVANPTAVKVLVLVAPAIVAGASFSSQDVIETKTPLLQAKGNSYSKSNSSLSDIGSPSAQQQQTLPHQITAVLKLLFSELGRKLLAFFLWLIQPVVVLALGMLVRSRAFWKRGLASAYYQKDFEERTIACYRSVN